MGQHWIAYWQATRLAPAEWPEFLRQQAAWRDRHFTPFALCMVGLIAVFVVSDHLLGEPMADAMQQLRLCSMGATLLLVLFMHEQRARISYRWRVGILYLAIYAAQLALAVQLGPYVALQVPGLVLTMVVSALVVLRTRDVLWHVPLAVLSLILLLPAADSLLLKVHLSTHIGIGLLITTMLAAAIEVSARATFLYGRRLLRESNTDSLTGLYNRRQFEQRAAEALGRARCMGRPLAFALLDLDRFKQLNDEHGHDVGDAMLRHLGGLLSRSVRGSDVLARIGGEEFALILPDTPPGLAQTILERLCREIAATPLPGGQLSCTVSIGLAQLGPGMTGWHDLYKQADLALYRAKAEGRNRLVCSEETLACHLPA